MLVNFGHTTRYNQEEKCKAIVNVILCIAGREGFDQKRNQQI
jgi:hypothetical protein